MSAEFPDAKKSTKIKTLARKIVRRSVEILVIALTLLFTYFFLALWGVIALLFSFLNWIGSVLRREASDNG